jgi:hypothetical protein
MSRPWIPIVTLALCVVAMLMAFLYEPPLPLDSSISVQERSTVHGATGVTVSEVRREHVRNYLRDSVRADDVLHEFVFTCRLSGNDQPAAGVEITLRSIGA